MLITQSKIKKLEVKSVTKLTTMNFLLRPYDVYNKSREK